LGRGGLVEGLGGGGEGGFGDFVGAGAEGEGALGVWSGGFAPGGRHGCLGCCGLGVGWLWMMLYGEEHGKSCVSRVDMRFFGRA